MSASHVPAADPAFRAWLFTIVRNLWIDLSRARTRRARLREQMAQAMRHEAGEATTEGNYAVREAFSYLSVEHQEILALVDIAGFSYEETGQLLSIPKGTVMSRVSRARQSLFGLLTCDVALPDSLEKSCER
ncbi:ECF RNA polymerase sigma factor SigE [Methyloligella halotolerans]|uniref:ECF RNA polymerase sigma factor SigE n=2 Tax=Methyloligella halotolerans TaxID=1177755 RepID=A0A1E2RUH8_9HYPH|nr:ECF RNA polymerase sigma factor SigE [Methyloligella halotolerans]